MTGAELIEYGAGYLASRGVEDAQTHCQWLLSYSMNLPRLSIILEPRMEIGESDKSRFMRLLERKSAGEPLSYILGEHDFMGIRLNVNPGVFIPRPETEQLVETFLRDVVRLGRTSLHNYPQKTPVFADIGTGSGCIAIAIAKKMGRSRIIATDISNQALECAASNIERHGLSQRVKLVKCDAAGALDLKADAVISNPPYIPHPNLGGLPREVLWEPGIALDGGERGISVIEKIISDAPRIIKPGGWLCMEIGDEQSKAVTALFKSSLWAKVSVLRDYSGAERFVFARTKWINS